MKPTITKPIGWGLQKLLETIPANDDDNNSISFSNEKIAKITGDIPINLNIRNGQKFLFISKEQTAYTHAIHKYPAKFFPELPRWIIQRYSKTGDLILDPFAGSGTTNLEAMLLMRDSVSVDVDPFSKFLTRAKTTVLDKNKLLKAQASIIQRLGVSIKQSQEEQLPQFPYRDKWFKPYILQELAYIKRIIKETKCNTAIKNFLLVCFSSIIRNVSEADNNCTRTVIRKKLEKNVQPGYPTQLFLKRLENNVSGMVSLASRKVASVHVSNSSTATNMPEYKDETFSLAITSPPYLNAVDYPRTHQLEMYWLDFASGSLRDLKSTHVGTEVVSALDYKILHKTKIKTADMIIKAIYEQDPRRAYIAYKFIQDMVLNLKEVYRVLKNEGYYVIVVGNNLVRGNLFESWRYFIEAASSLGYKVEKWFISDIIKHFIKVPRKERIEEDFILVLKKC